MCEFIKIYRKSVHSQGDISATRWPNDEVDQRSKNTNNNIQTLRTGEEISRSKTIQWAFTKPLKSETI